MTARKTTKTTPAPRFAHYAEKEATPTMQAYAEWLTRETGYAVDVQSVVLASWLRGEFQKSAENQTRWEQSKAQKAEEAEARKARAAERAAQAEQKRAERAERAKEREAAAKERAAKKAAAEAKRIERAKAVLSAAEAKTEEVAA